jgi:hypothetical protein
LLLLLRVVLLLLWLLALALQLLCWWWQRCSGVQLSLHLLLPMLLASHSACGVLSREMVAGNAHVSATIVTQERKHKRYHLHARKRLS